MKTELYNDILQLGHLLQEWRGENTIALHLEPSVSWAKYCLISTCNSLTHMQGILNNLRSVLHDEMSMFKLAYHLPRNLENFSWLPIDLGPVVVHLMSDEARTFYELEKLWPVAEIIEFNPINVGKNEGKT